MRKTLLTFLSGTKILLLSAGLAIGANQLKGQEKFWTDFKNLDDDSFNEQVIGSYQDKCEESYYYANKKDERNGHGVKAISDYGRTAVAYFDNDRDNFYEHVRVVNMSLKDTELSGKITPEFMRRVEIEDFFINRETGLIDYKLKGYYLGDNEWNSRFGTEGNCLHGVILLSDCFKDCTPTINEYKIGLTGEDFYNMGMDKRVKNLINAYKDETKLKRMLEYERYLGRKKIKDEISKKVRELIDRYLNH